MPSDQDSLRQVFADIDRLKAAKHPTIVGSDKGFQIVDRSWAEVPEPSKLAMLQDLDWSGVTNRDRGHILLGQLDPGKLTDPQRNRLIEMAAAEPPTLGDGEKPPVQVEVDVTAKEPDRAQEDFGRIPNGSRAPAPSPQTETVTRPVRPLTQELIECCQLDVWPGMATVVDFGLDSSSHLGALQFAIRNGLVTPQELDSAMGSGAKLTEIAQRGENPYRDVTFRTSWDSMMPEPEDPPVQEKPDARQAFADILRTSHSTPLDTRSDFQRALDEAGERVKNQQPRERDKDRGGPER